MVPKASWYLWDSGFETSCQHLGGTPMRFLLVIIWCMWDGRTAYTKWNSQILKKMWTHSFNIYISLMHNGGTKTKIDEWEVRNKFGRKLIKSRWGQVFKAFDKILSRAQKNDPCITIKRRVFRVLEDLNKLLHLDIFNKDM